jgi:hypothetical protein
MDNISFILRSLLTAFVVFLGSEIYDANTKIIQIEEKMKIVLSSDLKLNSSPENLAEINNLKLELSVKSVEIEHMKQRLERLERHSKI